MKIPLTLLGWGGSMAGFALNAILTASVLPNHSTAVVNFSSLGTFLYYFAIFGISLVAGLMLADIGRSLLGFLASYAIGYFLTWLALALPGLNGTIAVIPAEDVANQFTSTVFFPFPLLVGLLGSILGSVYTEP